MNLWQGKLNDRRDRSVQGKTIIDFITNKNIQGGFTLIELAVVVAILSVLSGITISNVNKWLKLAQINEAKTYVDNSVIKCLSLIRDADANTSPATINLTSATINDAQLNTLGYKLKTPDNVNCADLSIVPVQESESLLFEFGFQINSGEVNKIAFPASDQSSLGSCKSWAGENCGVSDAQLAIWAEEQALLEEKNQCEAAYSSWLVGPPPGTGEFLTWDSNTNTCDRPVFAFEGNTVPDQATVDARLEEQRAGVCNDKINEYKNQSFSGAVAIPECQGSNDAEAPTFYFCAGVEKASENIMNTCLANNIIAACDAAAVAALGIPPDGNHTGAYTPSTSNDVPTPQDSGWPSECTQTTYMCNGSEYDSEDHPDYVANCGDVEPTYPCSEGYPYTVCCAPGFFGKNCRSKCGPYGNDPNSSFCETFNTCSCYEP